MKRWFLIRRHVSKLRITRNEQCPLIQGSTFQDLTTEEEVEFCDEEVVAEEKEEKAKVMKMPLKTSAMIKDDEETKNERRYRKISMLFFWLKPF
jgi:hypothetical protein